MRDSMPYICVKSINGCFYYSISEICLNPFFEINTIGMRTKLKPNIFFKNLLNKNVLPYFEKKEKKTFDTSKQDVWKPRTGICLFVYVVFVFCFWTKYIFRFFFSRNKWLTNQIANTKCSDQRSNDTLLCTDSK